MEFTYLDYEMRPLTSISPNENIGDSLSVGFIQYDPNEKLIIFYTSSYKFKFTIPLNEIILLPNYIEQNKLAFNITHDSKQYQIKIFNQKKETLGEKTLKALYSILTKKHLKETKVKKKVDSKHIMTKPTEYQEEMFKKAKEKNIIVFLETGLGKTYISILLIKDIFGEPREANINNEIKYVKKTNKKILCLFKTVSLLLQQSKVIKQNTNLKVMKLYGNSENGNLYLHTKFKKVFNKKDVICATPECIYRYFTFGYLNENDFELIVLDECHHCKKDDYYNKLLKDFIFFKKSQCATPKILGLTASPCDDKVSSEEQLKNAIVDLCNNMNCYLECPRNIISATNEKEKKIEHIVLNGHLSDENEKQNKIKDYLFLNIILPILEFHFEKVYKALTSNFGIKKDVINNEEISEEEKKQKRKSDKQSKAETKISIAFIIINHYLTLFINDESKLNEKHLGLYTKSDIELISKLKEKLPSSQPKDPDEPAQTNKTFSLSSKLIDKVIDKLTALSEFSYDNDIINMTKDITTFAKRFKDDIILSSFKKYSKMANLLIKYANIESLSRYTKEAFEKIELDIFDVYRKEIADYEKNNEGSMRDIISNKFIPCRNVISSCPVSSYISSYLISLFTFIKNQNEEEKTIVFVNHRMLAREISAAINEIASTNKCDFNSVYVVGISNSNSSMNFNETQLKENLGSFETNNKTRMLIATNVVEEGIDVPKCNNVICLSEIVTAKEYIQKAGRARKENSKIIFFSFDSEVKAKKDNLTQIQIAIQVMKSLIQNNTIVPKIKKYNFIQNYNYYETILGARAVIGFSTRIVNELMSKLFNDGYNFVHTASKVEFIEKEKKYIPYLSLPSVLECDFQKIYDNDMKKFDTEAEAKKYYSKYEDYYYFKALMLLHKNMYLDDYLQFNKNYDDLISQENNFVKCESESHIKIKNLSLPQSIDNGFVEYTAHILKFSPNYFIINYDNPESRFITLLSSSPLALVNFDLFIPSNLLLKLYYFNSHFYEDEEEMLKWFGKKPKIPYTVFSKLNIEMENTVPIKLPKEKLDLITFFYTYSMFVSTDAEMFFYYAIYTKKFDFCKSLFTDKKIYNDLKVIFDRYDINYLQIKHHLKNYCDSVLHYEDHLVKFSILKYDQQSNTYSIDFDYIIKCYRCVIDEIKSYALFIVRYLQSEEEKEKLLSNEEYLKEKECKIEEEISNDDPENEPKVGCLCRNLFNFSKMIIMNYSQTDIRGETKHKRLSKFTYQQYYIYNYNILTRSMKDYKKCLVLDYNMKVMRYKINMKNLGKVNRKFSTFQYIKKYHFFPNEVIQKISFATVDQLYLFTLFPVILFKVQNSLIYYHNANCLMNEFKHSFSSIKQIDIKMVMQALNAKSTMEIENYERLEFLGDSILKLLSSIELFVLMPNANRDLLFSKRRIIENNKNLFEKGKERNLFRYLFTSPITIKRVMIPGFTKDESLIFDISYNRSFTKNCYLHKKQLLNELKEEEEGKSSKKKEIVNKDENEMENEKKTDKASIEVEYTETNPAATETDIALPVTKEDIENIINNKIEIVPGNTCRFIYTKTLADIVESLTAFVFTSSQYNNFDLAQCLNCSSVFLNEMKVLDHTYEDSMKRIQEVALRNLINKECKYNEKDQRRQMRYVLDNIDYKFEHVELFYQAMTHSTYLTDDVISKKRNYVNKSYQRLAFIGEALLCFYVSKFVYNSNKFENESSLHKMRICGINHHIISLMAIDLKLDDCIMKTGGDLNNDLENYKKRLIDIRNKSENKYKMPNEELLDENFVIILCELFHAYIGAIFLDCCNIKKTFNILDGIMKNYLLNNATKETFTEHPKVTILDEFAKRRQYFKKIRENGGNRIAIKFNAKEKFRKKKMYEYQLVIDKFIIYQESIAFSRTTIKQAQEKAKNIFLIICKEIDRREKLRLHQSKFDLKLILDYLNIKYQTLN